VSTDLPVTPSLVLPASALSWTAVRSSGPGGQNVNKVSTKVELRFDARAAGVLSEAAQRRLFALPSVRRDAEGRVLLTCDTTRSQSQNLELARARLAELVRQALTVPKRRRATQPTRASRARRLSDKRHASLQKRERSRGASD
jgi:ribosome-associated protein